MCDSVFLLLWFCSDVPWYADSEWNNVKGQLSTVDRHYGHVHSVIHSIGTHQIHHLFTKVPHYHLGMMFWLELWSLFLFLVCFFFSEEATTSFRKAFPELVRINEEPVLMSFARMFKIFITQRGIDHDVRIFTYSDDVNTNKKKLS